MNLQHVAFKIFVDGELDVDWNQFINIFHTWVANQSLPEMMIDVADYRHVPNGPGVVMIGHEADYYMDNTDGKPGLRYVRKVASDDGAEQQVANAFSAASSACIRLEEEIAGLRFSRTEFELTINDRAIAPNTAETRNALESLLSQVLHNVLGCEASLVIQQDERKLSGARIVAANQVEMSASK